MSNFEENKEISAEEESTIFSDPLAHKVTTASNSVAAKKRRNKIIAGILSVAVLIGSTIAVIKLIPEKDDGDTPISDPQIKVLTIAENDLKKVTVTNENGSFVFLNEITEEDGEEVYDWKLDGYDAEMLSSYSVRSAAINVTSIYALREITTKTAAECGLEKPQIKVDVLKYDGSEFSVLLGDKSLDNTGIYLKLSNSDKIFIVSEGLQTDLTFTDLDLADTTAIPALTLPDSSREYIEDGTISTFDSITISGKNFPKKLVIKPNPDEKVADLQPYVITSPTSKIAENVDMALAVFNSEITVLGAYAFDVSKATQKSLGLNNPDFVITGKFGDFSYTYKFKKQDDGYYAIIGSDSKMVRKIDVSAAEVIEYNTEKFYSTWVFLQSIEQLSGLTIESQGKEYKFDISVEKHEDKENTYTIKYGKKTLTARNFQEFYRYCISLYATDFETKNITEKPDLTMTYIYADKSKSPVVITFQRSSATKYQYSVNGVKMGNVNASDVNRIHQYVEQVSKDETVNII